MDAVYDSRIQDCQEALREQNAELLILSTSSNMLYLSGFTDEPSERHLLLFLSPDEPPTFVAPQMYADQLKSESVVDDIRPWTDSAGPRAPIENHVADCNAAEGTILVDDSMWTTFLLDLKDWFPNATFERASNILDHLRMRKDEREIDALRAAGMHADRVSEAIRGMGADAIGMTESELATEIERRLLEGADDIAFDTIVGSGPNGAHPHHRHSDREIEPGDPVVLDFGARVNGYPGDQTRTVVFDSSPPEEFESAHEAVVGALEAGIEFVEPGIEAGCVDELVRTVIEEAGYGDAFTHRTGHGVGLDVHEAPYIVEGNETKLEPGMVFSIEPGIYLEGEFGVRVEDLVVVTEEGSERLNYSPYDWQSL